MAFKYGWTYSGMSSNVFHVVKTSKPRKKSVCGVELIGVCDYPKKRHWICMKCMESIAFEVRNRGYRLRQIRDMSRYER